MCILTLQWIGGETILGGERSIIVNDEYGVELEISFPGTIGYRTWIWWGVKPARLEKSGKGQLVPKSTEQKLGRINPS